MECLNCGKEFELSENFCSLCGQDTLTHRLTTKHAVHHFFHSFTHTDKHSNLVIFFSIPLIAFFTSQFFKKRINFAESLVIVSYTSGERSIFFMLIVVPFLLLFKENYYPIIWSYVALHMVYYSWACCQYFNDYRIRTFIKGSLCFVLAQAIISLIIGLTIFGLVYQSKI